MAISPTSSIGTALPLQSDALRLTDAEVSAFQIAEQARQAQKRQQAAYQPLLDSPPLRSASAGLGAEAFEEITFQASEREEAELHDELHDRHVREAELIRGALPVEKVVAVMRLMEGSQGYQLLRTQARIFAKDFEVDPHGALERLKLLPQRPDERFALLRMAETFIEITSKHKPEAAATLQALRQLEHQDVDQIRHLIKVYEATQTQQDTPVSAVASPLLQLLSSPLSHRMVLDAVGSGEGLKALSRQVRGLPQEGHFESPATFVGLSVSLAQLMAVLRTMDDHATQLVKEVGLPAAEQPKLLRQLMDLCRTAAPKPKLEKLRTDLLKLVDAQRASQLDQALLKQVSQYPEAVWIHTDAKTAVQNSLRESQGLHYRRQGVLGPAGQLNRGALPTRPLPSAAPAA